VEAVENVVHDQLHGLELPLHLDDVYCRLLNLLFGGLRVAALDVYLYVFDLDKAKTPH